MTILDFIVRIFFAGESGNSLAGSLIVSTVRDLDFNIPSVSIFFLSLFNSFCALMKLLPLSE